MFVNPIVAASFGGLEFLVGALIAAGAAAVLCRTRFGVSLALRAALFGGIAFLVCMFLGGWAGAHGAFEGGRLVDVGPSGENLWLRNRIAEYDLAISIGSSIAAGYLAGLRSRKRE
jgi:hypothetical protein